MPKLVALAADAKSLVKNCKQLWLSLIILHFPCQYSKANSHDKEVQRLYEEMEQQIKTEKERIHNEVVIPRYCIMWCWARLNCISNFLCGLHMYYIACQFEILLENLKPGALSIEPKISSFQNGGKWYRSFLQKFSENLDIDVVPKSKPDSAKNTGFSRKKIKWNSSHAKKF